MVQFQRKISSVGGRLSPWVDEEEFKRRERRRSEEKSEPSGNKVETEPVTCSKLSTSPVSDPYWPRRKKNIQVNHIFTCSKH